MILAARDLVAAILPLFADVVCDLSHRSASSAFSPGFVLPVLSTSSCIRFHASPLHVSVPRL